MSASARVRARAASIVAQVALEGRSLDAVLLDDAAASAHERGLLRTLCYDSIRWWIRLDALLGRLLSRPGQKLAPEIHALAVVGLCQLLHTDIPAHAAVDETVNAARLLGHSRAAGMINAILRRAQREHATLLAEIDRDMAARAAHPRWLVERIAAGWGEQTETLLAANNARPPFWIRVNRLRSAGADYRKRLEAHGIAVSGSLFKDEALLLERALDVHDLPGFGAGEVSVQDAAAQLAAHLLAARDGERVLDACAAPGGKTGHILELTPRLDELVALDISAERMKRVEDNLRRLNLKATLRIADASEPEGWFDGRSFDRILIDAPCSGTGVIRRHPDIKLLRKPSDIPVMAQRQSQLLTALWPTLKPGGRLLYAACSIVREETTGIVERFLAAHADARDATAVAAIGQSASTERGLRIAVGTGGMDGFYYACLEKDKGS